MALNLAIFLNYHLDEITFKDLMMSLCSLSMKGDLRMKSNMENPDKIKNIVEGSIQELGDLYIPLILELEQEKGVIKFD